MNKQGNNEKIFHDKRPNVFAPQTKNANMSKLLTEKLLPGIMYG